MEDKITYQKLKKGFEDEYALAMKYYGIISVLNNLSLTERETQLIAYTAIRGNMTMINVREDFCKRYSSSLATINNIVSRMKEIGVMVKVDGKNVVNPAIVLDFKKEIVLQISLMYNKKKDG